MGGEKYMKEPKLRFKADDGSDFPDWEEKKLGELGTFTKGAALSKADISDEGNPLILYGELYTTYKEVAYEVKRKTQAIEIRMRCALLGTEMQHIRNELNKIGVNVNQIAKWNNIEAEIVQLKQSMAGKTAKERYEIVERVQFLQKCQNEILLRVVQPSDMEEYVQRYERATEGVSKALWHIQG